MRKRTELYLGIILLSLTMTSIGQIPVNSPYTRFGLGDLSETGFVFNKALGGASMGIRSNNQINPLNPASYSSQDTLSFILDFGLTGTIMNLYSENDNEETKNAGFEHLAVAFPVTRWWGGSIGIMPYSKVGYNMSIEGGFPFEDTEYNYNILYKGNGGLNRFFIGSSFKLGKYISFGGNFSYIFGSINRNKYIQGTNSREQGAMISFIDKMTLGGAQFNVGLQVFNTYKENHRIVAGIALDNSTKLKGDYLKAITYNYIDFDTVEYNNISNGHISVPLKFGAGLSYVYKNKFLVAFDYTRQDWGKADIFGIKDSLTLSNSFRFGLEYSPVALSDVSRSAYWKRIKFRAGGYYSNSYMELNGEQLTDYGMTFGVGLPWKNENNLFTNTSFNITYQLGQRGSLNNGLLKENYHILSIGLTLYDFWFVKPKYN